LSEFPFPARSISAVSLLAEYFVERGFRGAFALAPDKGAMHIAMEAQQVLGGAVGFLSKVRDRYTGQTVQSAEGLNVKGQSVVIFDDIISTGGTIVGAAKILKEQGAKQVFAACVHPLLIGDASKRMFEAGVEDIVGTDSVPGRFSKVSLAPLISKQFSKGV
jgi:ribose-phosphate pyrophosphokinase